MVNLGMNAARKAQLVSRSLQNKHVLQHTVRWYIDLAAHCFKK